MSKEKSKSKKNLDAVSNGIYFQIFLGAWIIISNLEIIGVPNEEESIFGTVLLLLGINSLFHLRRYKNSMKEKERDIKLFQHYNKALKEEST